MRVGRSELERFTVGRAFGAESCDVFRRMNYQAEVATAFLAGITVGGKRLGPEQPLLDSLKLFAESSAADSGHGLGGHSDRVPGRRIGVGVGWVVGA